MTTEYAAVTVEDQRTINKAVRRIENIHPLPTRRGGHGRNRGRSYSILFKAPSDGIPARDGNKPGFAECEIYEAEGEGAEAKLQPTGETEIIYNWASIVVCDQAGNYGVADLHTDLKYWVSAEECDEA